jgi:hypothetical protein
MSLAPFEAIQIGLASPEMIHEWSHGEVKEAGDNKLPHAQA